MLDNLSYLLLQVRNHDDPMRGNEVTCFARALRCHASRIQVFDLLSGAPGDRQLARVDMVLLGGSGHYSVADQGSWLDRALAVLREVYASSKPTFASCWGFQAMARAMGGRIINDVDNAELGTIQLQLTAAGRTDPLFGPLGDEFLGLAGHEDHVVELPSTAVRLATSARVANQAYCFPDRPIYCTQFHPELSREDLLARLRAYPEYVTRIAGVSLEEFAQTCVDTLATRELLFRFVQHFFSH